MFVVGGLGFELCVFVAGWRHALRSEWPFIIIINMIKYLTCFTATHRLVFPCANKYFQNTAVASQNEQLFLKFVKPFKFVA